MQPQITKRFEKIIAEEISYHDSKEFLRSLVEQMDKVVEVLPKFLKGVSDLAWKFRPPNSVTPRIVEKCLAYDQMLTQFKSWQEKQGKEREK